MATKSVLGLNAAIDADYLFDITADATTTADAIHLGGDTMTISPQSTAESGFIRVRINGTVYQIPVYAE